MHLMFVDESGNPKPPEKKNDQYFVLCGLILHSTDWKKLSQSYLGLKDKYGVTGEIKWTFFSPHNRDQKNPLRQLTHDSRQQFREELLGALVALNSVKIITVVGDILEAYRSGQFSSADQIYHRAYKILTERYQYYLQDEGRDEDCEQYGMVICDQQKSRKNDLLLMDFHRVLVEEKREYTSNYENLVECLLLAPSHFSIGIQFADLVAGAIYRSQRTKEEQPAFKKIEPKIRRSRSGKVQGYGFVTFPK